MIMALDKCTPPLILIGMHRSGTSMIARVLEELGVFMGKVKEEHHEAKLFRTFNDWLLRLSGAAWDHPDPTRHLLDNVEIRTLAADYIRYLMKTPRSISYLGFSKYLHYRTPARLDIPWGWKDPRNTYTLPLWLDLFSQAKIIYIYRNGVDVANSLKVRSEKDLSRINQWREQRNRRHKFERRPFPSILISLRCLSLQEGFALWESYTKRADDYIASLSADRTLAIRYEDFAEEPIPFIKKLCEFSGVEPSLKHINSARSKLYSTRVRIYKQVPELVEFYESVRNSSQMNQYSY